jgi:hypothetical protein
VRSETKMTPVRLLLLSAVAVGSVQASYTNALWVGILTLCSAASAMRAGSGRRTWLVFLPGMLAAASLLPYLPILMRAGKWASATRVSIQWQPFLAGYLRDHSILYPVAWAAAAVLAAWGYYSLRRSEEKLNAAAAYVGAAAMFFWAVQIGFVEISGVPPFPRYFIPALLISFLAAEAWTAALSFRFRAIAAGLILAAAAAPSWNWLRQEHSSMGRAAAALNRGVAGNDLVLITPWFLHPVFQRYFSGRADWATVPVIPRHPMMRYDLVREAMTRAPESGGVRVKIEEALASGGAIWLVSQRPWTSLERREAPPAVPAAANPNGEDYRRFRSYWERAVEYELSFRCRPEIVDIGAGARVWREEDLLLTRWTPRQ